MATALGFAKLCLFYGLWTGAGLVPFALLYAAATARPLPLLCAAFWLAYRLLFPAQPWPALRRVFCLDASPYFASQRLVFAGAKAAAPPADDARMLCFHPHGMLCCGWTVANAGAALRSARVTWLAADVLFLLPGIADFLRWNATEGVGAHNMRRLMVRRKPHAAAARLAVQR